MRYLLFHLFILLFSIGFTQNLAESELKLKSRLDELRSAKSDNEIKRINSIFTKEMSAFLRLDGAYQFQFTQLSSIADLKSEDGLVRIVHWNLEFKDFSYSYNGFIMHWDEEQETCKVFDLVDVTDPYTMISEQVVDSKNWYGALYYKILPFERNSRTEYLLMGWDGGTTVSNFKLLDVLTFNGSNLKLGSPVFKQKKSVVNRVVFEYSEKAKISLRYEDKYKRIVFDHLSPEAQGLEGVYSFYVPDMSYDCYYYDNEMWILKEDVIAVNDEDQDKTGQIYIIGKDGNVKKKTFKKKWLSPNDEKNSSEMQHIARTPESEEILKQDKQDVPKQKRVKKNKDSDPLSITTGKSKSRKKKKNN